MSEKLRDVNELPSEDVGQHEDGDRSSPKKRLGRFAGGLAAAAFAVGLGSAEAAPQQKEGHVRTNSEEGRTVGFAIVPQNEQELAAAIAKIEKQFKPGSPISEISALSYKAFYAAQKNDLEGLRQHLKQYYVACAKRPDLAKGIFTEAGESSVQILIEDGNFATARAILQEIPSQKMRVRLGTKIQMAEAQAVKRKK